MLSQPCILWYKSHLVIVYNTLQVLADSVCSYFSQDSVFKFIKYIALYFYLLKVFTGFDTRIILASDKKLVFVCSSIFLYDL